MIWLYRLIFLPAMLVLLPVFLWRTRGRGGWRENFANRFGRFAGVPPKVAGLPRIWLQAVSVGELLAIEPLLAQLRKSTGAEIFLTTTTTTGFALARERLSGQVLGPAFFPVDFWPWSARAWRAIAPDLVILAEGERWPEHIHQAARRGVPVVCVNARLSERGFRRARRFRWLALPCWRGITRVLAGSATDAQRFRELGMAEDRVQLTGSIKLDVDLPRLSPARLQDLRRELGLGSDGVIIGASTWPGEEAALLNLLHRARQAGLPARLLIVPRHVERRAELETLLAASPFTRHFRSQGVAVGEVDVAVGDSTGELRDFLQFADLVFVGRSLPPHTGGQTPIEAALFEKPLLFGPGMSNFRDIVDGMIAAGAAQPVTGGDDLCAHGTALLHDVKRRGRMAESARVWAAANRGAISRTVAIVSSELGKQSRDLTMNPRSA
jgi:3-deoxy-D-manno-octulosonic-acid transferase